MTDKTAAVTPKGSPEYRAYVIDKLLTYLELEGIKNTVFANGALPSTIQPSGVSARFRRIKEAEFERIRILKPDETAAEAKEYFDKKDEAKISAKKFRVGKRMTLRAILNEDQAVEWPLSLEDFHQALVEDINKGIDEAKPIATPRTIRTTSPAWKMIRLHELRDEIETHRRGEFAEIERAAEQTQIYLAVLDSLGLEPTVQVDVESPAQPVMRRTIAKVQLS